MINPLDSFGCMITANFYHLLFTFLYAVPCARGWTLVMTSPLLVIKLALTAKTGKLLNQPKKLRHS